MHDVFKLTDEHWMQMVDSQRVALESGVAAERATCDDLRSQLQHERDISAQVTCPKKESVSPDSTYCSFPACSSSYSSRGPRTASLRPNT